MIAILPIIIPKITSASKMRTSLFKMSLAATVIALATVTCGSPNSDPISEDLTTLIEPFDIEVYQEIRPEPQIRSIDRRIDSGFDEREKLPRDAISPIYTPKYVNTDEVQLSDDELVLGVEINGDARAMPVGLLRFREMVNDVIGGIPVLATW